MKTISLMIALTALFASCEKAPVVNVQPRALVAFEHFTVPDGPDNGRTMPDCSDAEPVYFYYEYRFLSGGGGGGTLELGRKVEMAAIDAELMDFQLLDADYMPLYRMPRAYKGRAFELNLVEGLQTIKVPVECNE